MSDHKWYVTYTGALYSSYQCSECDLKHTWLQADPDTNLIYEGCEGAARVLMSDYVDSLTNETLHPYQGNWSAFVVKGEIVGILHDRGAPDDVMIKWSGNFDTAEEQQFIGLLLSLLNGSEKP